MQCFFSLNDDFQKIIKKYCPKVLSYRQISTGWTNFVFVAKTKKDDYIFRFPRNEFFSKAIEKEFFINNFLQNKLSVKIPKMKLFYENSRPFSIHKKLNGECLSFCYNDLSNNELKILAQDICNLLKEFSEIKLENTNFQLVSNFLDNLSKVSKNNYDLKMHNYIKTLEQNHLIFSHGDLNPGNVILKNHKLYGVIDFAFAGTSYDLVDLSRLLGRCPKEFQIMLLETYENKFGKIDSKKVQKLQNLWAYVEKKYILYMKQNCPDIKLSNLT